MIVKGGGAQEASVGSSNSMYIDCLGSTTGTNNNIIFRNTSSNSSFTAVERARINANGEFYVGATALGSDANYFAFSPGNALADFGHGAGVASGISFTRFLYAGSVIGSITQNGVSQVLYNISSDQRLKENIQDSDSASSLIDALQVRQFNWKADGSHQRYGLVAQELVTVSPEAVHQPTDP